MTFDQPVPNVAPLNVSGAPRQQRPQPKLNFSDAPLTLRKYVHQPPVETTAIGPATINYGSPIPETTITTVCMMCGFQSAVYGTDYCSDCQAKVHRKPEEWDAIRARKSSTQTITRRNKALASFAGAVLLILGAFITVEKLVHYNAIHRLVAQGQVCFESDNYDGAIQAYQQALALSPDHGSVSTLGTVENIDMRIGVNYFHKGISAAHNGDDSTGMADINAGLGYYPNSKDAREILQQIQDHQTMIRNAQQEAQAARSQQLAEQKTVEANQTQPQPAQPQQSANFVSNLETAIQMGELNVMGATMVGVGDDTSEQHHSDVSGMIDNINELQGMLPECDPTESAAAQQVIDRETSAINKIHAIYGYN
jgi:hypothetical protein